MPVLPPLFTYTSPYMPYQVQPFGEYPCQVTVATVDAYSENLRHRSSQEVNIRNRIKPRLSPTGSSLWCSETVTEDSVSRSSHFIAFLERKHIITPNFGFVNTFFKKYFVNSTAI